MKATYFLGNGKFETREVTLREPADDEVVVKVAACGTAVRMSTSATGTRVPPT